MRLDRNTTNPKRSKYALIKLRNVSDDFTSKLQKLAPTEFVRIKVGDIDFGLTDDSEFFVIRLKDRFASAALYAYALVATRVAPEYGADVQTLAEKSHRMMTSLPNSEEFPCNAPKQEDVENQNIRKIPAPPLKDWREWYSHAFICGNCGNVNPRQIRAAIRAYTVSTICDKCRCVVPGKSYVATIE